MKKSQLYKRLRDAVEARGDDSDAVDGMSAAAVRSIIGPEADGMTVTMLENAMRTLAAELRRKEMQTVADWIVTGVKTRFAGAQVKIRRRGVIEVWLEGLPEEIE